MSIVKKQREYPRVIAIKDEDAKESIRLLWDRHHEQVDLTNTLKTTLDSAQSTIAAQQKSIDSLKQQMTIISAGGGIASRSSVGGAGSSGSSGGSGTGTSGGGTPTPPPPSDIPNQSSVVVQAKADLVAIAYDLTTACGAWQICNTAAFRLGGNYGLLSKTDGNNCNGMSVDIIAVKVAGSNQMPIFDVLTDASSIYGPGTNGPVWNFNGYADVSRWVAPQTPPV